MASASTTTTPPLIQAPGAKEKKYDRQLRLWAANGQQALEESHVLVVVSENSEESSGSSVAGIETLKNLVLPGIGQFTIADTARVTQADLGVNFFLTAQSLGASRAEECTRLLQELNPDVKGHAISTPLPDLLQRPDWFLPYNLIIFCAPIPPKDCRRICEDCQKNSIPLMQVRSAGFYSSFSLQLPSIFPIVDTHPDPDTIQDLRLLSPWPELVAEVKALGDLDRLENHEHGHVPYILILLYYLEKWKEAHNDKYPQNFKEKTQFRDMVKAGARMDNAEGAEENFDEAAGSVLKTISPFTLKSGCADMFREEACSGLTVSSANFWVIAAAVKAFYQSHKVLPLPGSLPDMKAKSADYIKLQNIFKSKARRDGAEVARTVRATEEKLGRSSPIPEAEIEAFCKNAAHIKVLKGSLLPQIRSDEDDAPTMNKISKELGDPDTLLPIFLGVDQHGRTLLKKQMAGSTSQPSHPANFDALFAELDRVGSRELHNISSLTGGMVAQEAIKILTRQYVPVDNTCIFDGIKGRTQLLRL